ncbi:MAG: hypothetical protein ACKOUT_05205 [Novosphingobium sp.]
MATVIDFAAKSADLKSIWLDCEELKAARLKEKITLTQAVCALESELGKRIAPKTLENWEYKQAPGIDPKVAAGLYAKFAKDATRARREGKNLIFGSIPISVAKDILDFTDADIERHFGYKPSYWAKIEANSRFLPEKKMDKLEVLMQKCLSGLCGN